MTILASLNRAYGRLAQKNDVPTFGYSNEKISFVISLNPDGSVAGAPHDIRDVSGKKPSPRLMSVPASFKRPGTTPRSFFLWDKAPYSLGIADEENGRVKEMHQSFVDFHTKVLGNAVDEGLNALLLFLRAWNPDNLSSMDWPEQIKADIKGQNIVFALEDERLQNIYLHDREAARFIWANLTSAVEKESAICLVTGTRAPVARLHPAIKGVWGGQSSGGSIVSFNLDAFTSYGHEQGDNAPISEAAAFAYTTVLNKFLEKGSPNRIQIGDASVVFWADASEREMAEKAETAFPFLFEPDDGDEAKTKIKPVLDSIRQGTSLSKVDPSLEGVRFYILGLAPNAARISIRFWFENTFGTLVANYQRFIEDMRIEPPDRDAHISLWKYFREIAVLGKTENIPPNLSGEWMRAIITGYPYPLSFMANTLMRVRADKTMNARRVAILKAVLIRNFSSKEASVALDSENRNKGYLLGRLFAVYERMQAAALGDHVNATIKDRFYGAASAQPRKVFPLLDKGAANHLSKVGKKKPGQKIFLEKQVGAIFDLMSPADDPYPVALSAEEQALFALGYYHQHSEFFKTKSTEATSQKENAQ